MGAHITLVTADEAKTYGLEGGQVEIGRRVTFSVRKCGVSFLKNRSYGLEAKFKDQEEGGAQE